MANTNMTKPATAFLVVGILLQYCIAAEASPLGKTIAQEQLNILKANKVNAGNETATAEVLEYLSNLSSNWDTTLALPTNHVADSAQWWHKMFRFYFAEENMSCSTLEDLAQSPRELSLNSYPLSIPNELKSFKRDYEYPDLTNRAIELRLQKIEVFSKMLPELMAIKSPSTIVGMYFVGPATELGIPQLSKQINCQQLDRISMAFREIEGWLTRMSDSSRMDTNSIPFNDVLHRSMDGLLQGVVTDIFKANPTLFAPFAHTTLNVLEEKISAMIQYSKKLKEGATRDAILGNLIVFTSKVESEAISSLKILKDGASDYNTKDINKSLYSQIDAILFGGLGTSLLPQQFSAETIQNMNNPADWHILEQSIYKSLPSLLNAATKEDVLQFAEKIKSFKAETIRLSKSE